MIRNNGGYAGRLGYSANRHLTGHDKDEAGEDEDPWYYVSEPFSAHIKHESSANVTSK
jgi:hypothetical protein